jgi:hypothetical protein
VKVSKEYRLEPVARKLPTPVVVPFCARTQVPAAEREKIFENLILYRFIDLVVLYEGRY